MRFQRLARSVAFALPVLGALPLSGQRVAIPGGDSLPPPPAPAPAVSLPFEFSGVLFLNFQSGGNKTQRQTSLANRFETERAYLTFRAPAGERMSIRITADLYQQRDSTRDQFYSGWAFRAKYAYAQYDYIPGALGEFKAVARMGMLHSVVIDYEETFWPRGLASAAVEQNGYFNSSDLGATTSILLPNKMGEIYGGVWNGAGYTTRETDRFKDVGARVSLTPLMNGTSALRTLSITPWYLTGAQASGYVRKKGTVLATNEGRQKDRYGLHLAIKDPRLMLATQLAWRVDGVETADTTVDTAPTVTERKGSLVSAYTIVKPLAFFESLPSWPIMAMVRVDKVKTDVTKDPFHQQTIAGLGYDLNKKAQLWLDFQNTDAKKGSTATDLKTLFLHAIVNF
jgi:hypothetical protein